MSKKRPGAPALAHPVRQLAGPAGVDDGAPKLAGALEVFAAAYQQRSPEQERLHDEGIFQAGVYRLGHGYQAQFFMADVTHCLDPNRRDPHRHEQMKRRGLVTADGIAPMGVKKALALI